MILIPPTHGRAALKVTVSAEEIVLHGEDPTRAGMVRRMNDLFWEEFGVDVPESWLSWSTGPGAPTGAVEIRLEATAPTRARSVLLAPSREVLQVLVPVTPQSRIPIVENPYSFAHEKAYTDPRHVLTFAGWDAETGLMVFDR